MKLAIMQPYLFPYIGYFQMVASVDRFVFYDDVNFIKNGWINRNRCLHEGKPHYFTVPLMNAGSFRQIREVEVQPNSIWRKKMLALIFHAYRRAPCFEPVFALFERVVSGEETHIGEMAKKSVREVTRYLDVATDLVWSSTAYENQDLKGQGRVLDICKREGATDYVNLPGGQGLYDAQSFEAEGLRLAFIAPCLDAYDQGKPSFVPGLSIIDVLMFNPPAEVRRMIASAGGWA